MTGVDVHTAVSHKKRPLRVRRQVCHHQVDTGGIRLYRHAGDLAPDQVEHAGEEVLHDGLAELMGLVGVDRQSDAPVPQVCQQLRDAVIGGRAVQVVLPVIGGKLLQRLRQLLGAAALRRGEFFHQIGNSMAHHGLEFLHRICGPAVLPAHPVARPRQIVNGIEQRSVQVKNHGLIHAVPLPFFKFSPPL